MPKLKTKSSAKKRFTLTGTNLFRRFKTHHSHKLISKTSKQKRNFKKITVPSKIIKKYFPYSAGLKKKTYDSY